MWNSFNVLTHIFPLLHYCNVTLESIRKSTNFPVFLGGYKNVMLRSWEGVVQGITMKSLLQFFCRNHQHHYENFLNIIIAFIVDINALPWLKRAFWSVFLPKTLGREFQIPGRMFFCPAGWLKCLLG